MKTLFVGDLHAKYHILEKVKELSKNYNQVIFLGDYVDDWNAVPEASYNLLKSLIEFRLDNPGKIHLLLGNHDLSEWFGRPFTCSGYNPLTSKLVEPNFSTYEHIFDIAYSDDTFIATHAGITKGWWNKYLSETPCKKLTPKVYADALNWTFHHRNTDVSAEEAFYGLADVGYLRGGHNIPSPLWADASELMEDGINSIQIVGHTPQRTVTFYNIDKEIYFCDTFSTYTDNSPYGDNTLLVVENEQPYKIDLDGHVLSW